MNRWALPICLKRKAPSFKLAKVLRVSETELHPEESYVRTLLKDCQAEKTSSCNKSTAPVCQ